MSDTKINHDVMVANGLRTDLAAAQKRIAKLETALVERTLEVATLKTANQQLTEYLQRELSRYPEAKPLDG